MNTPMVAIPDALYEQLKQVAEQRQISVDQFVASAVAEKMAAVDKEDYMEQRSKPADDPATAPEQALAQWFRTQFLASMSLPESTEPLLTLLAESPSSLRNTVFALLLRVCTPDEILDASLARYERTCEEQYLLQALSLLESFGKEAWPALMRLARSKRSEAELFVGLIARCREVAEDSRLSALMDIAKNPYTEVRCRLFEYLPELEEESQRRILRILAEDSEVRNEALEYLRELE